MSESSENLTTVTIYNQSYRLRSGGDDEMVQKLARHVDATMNEIAESTPTVDTVRVAILAALTIAGEYFATREELERHQDEVAQRCAVLVERLKQAQAEPAA